VHPLEKRFYTVKEIADDLGVKEDTVRDWIRRRELAAYRVGRELRIKKEDYEIFLAKRRIESQDE
jgi:putative molybdopterin biosynthesis protein